MFRRNNYFRKFVPLNYLQRRRARAITNAGPQPAQSVIFTVRPIQNERQDETNTNVRRRSSVHIDVGGPSSPSHVSGQLIIHHDQDPSEENLPDNSASNESEEDVEEIPEPTNPATESGAPCNFFKTHLDIMYYLGLSPYNGSGVYGSTCRQIIVGIIIIVMLFLQLLWFKKWILFYVTKGNLYDYIQGLYYSADLVLGTFFMVCILRRNQIVKDIQVLLPGHQPKTNRILYMLTLGPHIAGMATFFHALLKASWAYRYFDFEWTAEQILQAKAASLRQDVIIWPGHNVTIENEVYDNAFYSKLSALTAFMAIISTVFEYFMTLVASFARDTMLITSLNIFYLTVKFNGRLRNISLTNKKLSWRIVDKLFNEYEQIYLVSNKIDRAFGKLFNMLHFYNWLMCAYSALELLQGRLGPTLLFLYATEVSKIVIQYTRAYETSRTSGRFQELIRKQFYDYKDGYESTSKKTILLKQIKHSPVGVGKAKFYIDGSFIHSFIMLIGSCFFFLWTPSANKSNSD